MKKNKLANIDKNGEIKFNKKGHIIALTSITTGLFIAGLMIYGYNYSKYKSSVSGTITTYIENKQAHDHVIELTDESPEEIQGIIEKSKSKGYKTASVLIFSDNCKRCQAHKKELAVHTNQHANKENLVILANYAKTWMKGNVSEAVQLPDSYKFPTYITYKSDAETIDSKIASYRIEPLFQNTTAYFTNNE